MKQLSLIILVLLIYGCLSMAVKEDTRNIEFEYSDKVDALADTFLMDTLMNSLSIGIYYKGETFIKHYGELDPGEGNTPNNSTIYDIGSVTKTFVGTLIAMAETEGLLSLEDDVRDYLEGAYPNLEYEKQPIRIKHLVTHTSRLPRYIPVRIMDEFNEINADLPNRISKIEMDYSKTEYFKDLKNIVIDTLPGYRYEYSSGGSELACYILETVYEMPFEEILEEKLFKKAHMTSTMINVPSSLKQKYANGYGDYKNLTPASNTQLWGGSGHGKSTVPDLMNYIKYHLNEDNPTVQKSHQVLFEGDIIDGDPRIKMGYMWKVCRDRGFDRYIRHHGGAYGVQNWMFIYPDEQMGISVVTNQSGWHTGGKLAYVVNGILDEIE